MYYLSDMKNCIEIMPVLKEMQRGEVRCWDVKRTDSVRMSVRRCVYHSRLTKSFETKVMGKQIVVKRTA